MVWPRTDGLGLVWPEANGSCLVLPRTDNSYIVWSDENVSLFCADYDSVLVCLRTMVLVWFYIKLNIPILFGMGFGFNWLCLKEDSGLVWLRMMIQFWFCL